MFLLMLSYRHFSPYSQPSIVQFISGNLANDVATCNHTQISISASSEQDPKPLCLLNYAKKHCQQAHQLINRDYRLIQTDIQLLGQVATTPAFSPRSILQFSVADLHQEMRDEAGVGLGAVRKPRATLKQTWWPEAPFLLTNATTRSPLAQRSPPAGLRPAGQSGSSAGRGPRHALLSRPRAVHPAWGLGHPLERGRPAAAAPARNPRPIPPAHHPSDGRKGPGVDVVYFNHRPPRAVVVGFSLYLPPPES